MLRTCLLIQCPALGLYSLIWVILIPKRILSRVLKEHMLALVVLQVYGILYIGAYFWTNMCLQNFQHQSARHNSRRGKPCTHPLDVRICGPSEVFSCLIRFSGCIGLTRKCMHRCMMKESSLIKLSSEEMKTTVMSLGPLHLH